MALVCGRLMYYGGLIATIGHIAIIAGSTHVHLFLSNDRKLQRFMAI